MSTTHFRTRAFHRAPRLAALLASAALLFSGACGDDGPSAIADALCAGQSGLGARITGRAAGVDFCVPDDDISGSVERGVVTTFTAQNRYDVTARKTLGDGTLIEIEMLFPHRADAPAALNLTANLAQATGDPDGAWLYYREVPAQGEAVESATVTAVGFVLSFSDGEVAAGTMRSVSISLEGVSSQTPAGTRAISEGFFSISTDP